LRSERLVSCNYFTIHRHLINAALRLPHENRCRIIIVLEGEAEIWASGEPLAALRGETVLVPAAGGEARIVPRPKATVLEVFW
jgi:mannose-6-phosphate isomerase class I